MTLWSILAARRALITLGQITQRTARDGNRFYRRPSHETAALIEITEARLKPDTIVCYPPPTKLRPDDAQSVQAGLRA